jgi:hypothetical protein
MCFRSRKGWRGARALPVALLLASGIALSQAQTGNVYARASDDSGQPIPGASVTLSGIGAPVSRLTNQNGEARFVSLSPGVYALEFVLPGFTTVSRKNVTVEINRNTQIDVTMRLVPVKEDLVVTGESPLLDTRTTGTSTVATQRELEILPTGRSPWVIFQTVPGIQTDRVDVGAPRAAGRRASSPRVTAGETTPGAWMASTSPTWWPSAAHPCTTTSTPSPRCR